MEDPLIDIIAEQHRAQLKAEKAENAAQEALEAQATVEAEVPTPVEGETMEVEPAVAEGNEVVAGVAPGEEVAMTPDAEGEVDVVAEPETIFVAADIGDLDVVPVEPPMPSGMIEDALEATEVEVSAEAEALEGDTAEAALDQTDAPIGTPVEADLPVTQDATTDSEVAEVATPEDAAVEVAETPAELVLDEVAQTESAADEPAITEAQTETLADSPTGESVIADEPASESAIVDPSGDSPVAEGAITDSPTGEEQVPADEVPISEELATPEEAVESEEPPQVILDDEVLIMEQQETPLGSLTETQLEEMSILKGMSDTELEGMMREEWYSYDQLVEARDYWDSVGVLTDPTTSAAEGAAAAFEVPETAQIEQNQIIEDTVVVPAESAEAELAQEESPVIEAEEPAVVPSMEEEVKIDPDEVAGGDKFLSPLEGIAPLAGGGAAISSEFALPSADAALGAGGLGQEHAGGVGAGGIFALIIFSSIVAYIFNKCRELNNHTRHGYKSKHADHLSSLL